MKTLSKILVILILVLLTLPAIQKEFPFAKMNSLSGSFKKSKRPELSWHSWYSGAFQTKYTTWIEEHIGFRDFLVRLTNQIDFSLYRVPHAEGVVIGKEDQLYEYDYIREYFGGDFVGEAIADKNVRELKFLQEYLKKKKNIDLIFVFEPGKATVYPEYIPDHFFKQGKSETNTDIYLQKVKQYSVKYIDLNAYYLQLKGHTPYPIYPPYGIHWSVYGMTYAADSLIKYIENLRHIDMLDVYLDSLEIEQHARRPDYDIANAMNLLWRLPEKQKLAYPVYRFEENPDKTRPMVLTVADSYYWNIFNTRIPKHLFKNEAFWYFNALVYPDSYFKKKKTDQLNLKKQIEKQDVILLMVTKRFLYKFDWGFLDQVYKLYAPTSKYDHLFSFEKDICKASSWFDMMIEKAKIKKIPLGEKIKEDANYMFLTKYKADYLTFRGLKYYEEKIEHNKKWFQSVSVRAKQKKLSVDEMVRREAVYSFKKDYPDLFAKNSALRKQKEIILKDSALHAKMDSLSAAYYMTSEEALEILAEQQMGKKD